MTPPEFVQIVDYIRARWPSARMLSTADKVYYDFQGIPHAAVAEAIQNAYRDGLAHPPAWSTLYATSASIAKARGLVDPTATSCELAGDHPALAIMSDLEMDHPGPGKRRVVCVSCKAEWIRPANRARTVGEIDAGIWPAGAPDDTGRDIAP